MPAPKTPARKPRAAKAPAVPALPPSRDGALLLSLREAGKSWPEIIDAVGAKSAIPLRKVLRAYLAANPAVAAESAEGAKVAPLAATPENAARLRDAEGAGFPLIAARLGVSVSEARDLYARGGGATLSGRVYVGAAGATVLGPDRIARPLSDVIAERREAEAAAAGRAIREAAAKAPKTARKPRAKRAASPAPVEPAKAASAPRRRSKRTA